MMASFIRENKTTVTQMKEKIDHFPRQINTMTTANLEWHDENHTDPGYTAQSIHTTGPTNLNRTANNVATVDPSGSTNPQAHISTNPQARISTNTQTHISTNP